MKSPLLTLLLILPVALPLAARRPRAKKKPPAAASPALIQAPPARLQSDTALSPAGLSDALILECVHSGVKPHASDSDTLAAVRRTSAGHEFDSTPRSVVVGVNFAVPGVEQPMLAFLSDKTEANLCLIGRRGGEVVLVSGPGETVGAGDPVNSRFATWSTVAGERYYLLNTRKTDGNSAGLECLRLYSLDGAGSSLKFNDSACEQAGSWSSGALAGGGTYYKGSDYMPTLHEWNAQCITVSGAGVPNPNVDHRGLGELTPEVYCAGKPRLVETFYEIQAGKLHIYRTINPPAN